MPLPSSEAGAEMNGDQALWQHMCIPACSDFAATLDPVPLARLESMDPGS